MKRPVKLTRQILWSFLKRTAAVIVTLLVVFVAYLILRSYTSPPHGPVGVKVPPDENLRIAQISDNGVHIVNNTRNEVGDGLYRRDAHPKAHGCALASFNVMPMHDGRLVNGLFGKASRHQAWVRFSSGDFQVQSDWKPDARGMAVKVLGVEGTKLLEGEQNATTQDFLMINHPVFFIRNANEYTELTTHQSQGDKFAYFFPGKNPANWRMREFRLGLGILGTPPPRSLLSTQFHSMSAYRLGTAHFMKFSAKPVACAADRDVPSGWSGFGANTLHESLAENLKSGKACFDFMVQLQAPEKHMPVEDLTIEWKESDSPFITVARIEIGKQDIEKTVSSDFCENLSFSPWHSLPEHEPVGGLNRIRKAVYQNIARYRRCTNGKFFGEPADDGSQTFTTQPCSGDKPVPDVLPGAKGNEAKLRPPAL